MDSVKPVQKKPRWDLLARVFRGPAAPLRAEVTPQMAKKHGGGLTDAPGPGKERQKGAFGGF